MPPSFAEGRNHFEKRLAFGDPAEYLHLYQHFVVIQCHVRILEEGQQDSSMSEKRSGMKTSTAFTP